MGKVYSKFERFNNPPLNFGKDKTLEFSPLQSRKEFLWRGLLTTAAAIPAAIGREEPPTISSTRKEVLIALAVLGMIATVIVHRMAI